MIGTAKRKQHVVSMVEEFGCKHHDHAGIAEVFAAFYEQLYKERKIVDGPPVGRSQLEPFTIEELTNPLKKMRRGKASDDMGCRNVEESFRDAAGCDPGSVQ